jgi:hypothetical protein
MVKLFLIIPIILLVLFLRFCIVSIKKQWIDKQPISAGDQFTGQNILRQFKNSDEKAAIEHIVYMEVDESEENTQEKLDLNNNEK